MRHDYLAALQTSGCATPATGWQARFVTLWVGDTLHAACPMYLKQHSYGEYVFDWAWANAYEQHGLPYYPKALVAVPFTPVPGARLLARDPAARGSLPPKGDDLTLGRPGDEVVAPTLPVADVPEPEPRFTNFEHFLSSLQQEKRKKIRQERRKVAEAGVSFRWSRGADISSNDWDFFYRCYERTYLEHGNAPYLNRDFFHRLAHSVPENWLLFVAEREGRPVAASLIGIDAEHGVAYGRYWGALERVDCLHFEACYYQPLAWCIEHGFQRFEGGAQGEHKMARALLPVRTTSAHWLAHPAFADAVERFLQREGDGIGQYLEHLSQRSPLKVTAASPDAPVPHNRE
jgi:predicted N-acyltransferase